MPGRGLLIGASLFGGALISQLLLQGQRRRLSNRFGEGESPSADPDETPEFSAVKKLLSELSGVKLARVKPNDRISDILGDTVGATVAGRRLVDQLEADFDVVLPDGKQVLTLTIEQLVDRLRNSS